MYELMETPLLAAIELDHPLGDTAAVIVAGGAGTRFGVPGGKLLVDLHGMPLLCWTLRAFDEAPSVDAIILVCSSKDEPAIVDALAELSLATQVIFAKAGETRRKSCLSGIRAVSDTYEYCLIHDGARPLIMPDLIERTLTCLRREKELDGVIVGQPAVDTMKIVDEDGLIERTPDRSRFWTVQTPQTFRTAALRAAHEFAELEGREVTDDASVVEANGGRVACIQGPRDNIKVTLPEDIELAEAILTWREAQFHELI